MSFTNSYTFNNMGRIGADSTDATQKNLYNTRFTNYTLANYFSQTTTDDHVNFAIKQPTMNFNGTTHGVGLNPSIIDTDSLLTLKTQQERAFERVQLFERPFLTVPYLGKGSCDPALESQLQQGEMISDKKSVSTIMEKSFSKYALYPTDDNMEERVKNPSYYVEESALDGWIRGGMATREMSADEVMKKNNRPNVAF
jgi:hypothetical protein